MLETFHYLTGEPPEYIRWWQMCVRALAIFTYAIVLYRVMPRRAFGSNAALDIVVVVILGSSLSRALSGSAPILPTMAATTLLAVLYGGFSYIAMRWDFMSRLLKGRRMRLIRNGEIDHEALQRARLGQRDLMENLRASGVDAPDQVADAFLERNGKITVIRK